MARQKMRWTFTVVDREGVKAPATLYGMFDDTLTVAAMLADLTAMRANIAAVTTARYLAAKPPSRQPVPQPLPTSTIPTCRRSVTSISGLARAVSGRT